MRMLALCVAFTAVSLSAQEPNPYAKAKVGDYAVYKTTTKVDNKVTNCVGASSNSPDC